MLSPRHNLCTEVCMLYLQIPLPLEQINECRKPIQVPGVLRR